MCGRGAFFFFFNSIDSHLPPPIHPPSAATVQHDEDKHARSDRKGIRGLWKHMQYVSVWVDGCLVLKRYVLFTLIILTFPSLPPSPQFFLRHITCSRSLTLNPLSGCRTAGSEETLCESVYRVSPRALLSIYPAPRVHSSPSDSSTKLRISAFLFAIKNGTKRTLFYFFFSLFSIYQTHITQSQK